MTYMIVSKLRIQTLYTALFQFKCCDSSIDLDEISLPSSTVIEGLLQEHPSLLSLSDVQEAVSVSKSTQECLKPEPEPVFQVTEKVVKTGPRKGKTEQKVTLVIGPYIFKRRKNLANGTILFTCNGCQNAGVYLSAVACVSNEGGADQYKLTRTPDSDEHVCWATSDQVQVKMA